MIQTATGAIPLEKLGKTLIHEHVVCCSRCMLDAFGDKWIDREKLAEQASAQMRKAHEQYGVDTIVDGTPINLGRDVYLIADVAKRAGINLIVSSGLYYTDEPFLAGKPAELLAEYFIDECLNGIQGTSIRPGILKCASEPQITSINRRILEAIGLTQAATGLPVFAHCYAKAKLGLQQLKIFSSKGADLAKIIIGHSNDSDDIEYLEALLSQGCYLGMDRFYDWMSEENLAMRIHTICRLVEHGWIDKLLLSHDYASYIDFGKNRWEETSPSKYLNLASDYTFLFRKIIPILRQRGFTEQEIHHILVDNPCALLDRY